MEVKPIPKKIQVLADKIQSNNPGLRSAYSESLAWTFIEAGEHYGVNPKLMAAIAMQESGYTSDAKQCYVINHKIRCDYCMMQINDHTAKAFGFKIKDLMESDTLCIEAGARVLADLKKRYAKKDKNWWTRYNAVTFEKREVYRELVERFL